MSIRGKLVAASFVGVAAAAAAFVVYPRFGRERCLQWGATVVTLV